MTAPALLNLVSPAEYSSIVLQQQLHKQCPFPQPTLVGFLVLLLYIIDEKGQAWKWG